MSISESIKKWNKKDAEDFKEMGKRNKKTSIC
jgi:hypothetical protein